MGRIAIAALAAVAVSGCVREPDPFPLDGGDLSVHLVLSAGDAEVAALVVRSGDGPSSDVVTDAEIRLMSGTDTTTLVYDPDLGCGFAFQPGFGGLPCYYGTSAEPIQPGATYHLEILLADGHRITGTTTVPQPVEILEPTQGAVVVAQCGDPETCDAASSPQPPYFVPVGAVEVRWEAGPGHDQVLASLRSVRPFLDGVAYAPGACYLGYGFGDLTLEGDSDTWSIVRISCGGTLAEARFDSIQAELLLATADPAYLGYLEAVLDGQTVREATVSATLDGAWGIFTAVAPARRALTIVRNPPPAP